MACFYTRSQCQALEVTEEEAVRRGAAIVKGNAVLKGSLQGTRHTSQPMMRTASMRVFTIEASTKRGQLTRMWMLCSVVTGLMKSWGQGNFAPVMLRNV